MPEHLVFTLTAALGAMGDLAGHERRGSLAWPGRSAVLGLVAAAMGVRRGDAAGLAALEPLRTAVAVHDDGLPLRDYHTVETVPTAKAKRPDSRPAALVAAGRDSNTAITLRDYRMGVAYGVALWGGPLEGIAQALHRPVFTLYLGRKSCPLAAPPAPRIVAADDPLAALATLRLPPFRHAETRTPEGWRCSMPPVLRLVASDEPLDGQGHSEMRNDAALDRAAWHFTARRVHLHHPEEVR